MHDGYQIKYLLDLNPQTQKLSWSPVPLGQHEYVITDPAKQIEHIVNKMRTVTFAHNEKPFQFDGYVSTNGQFGNETVPQIVITYGGENGFTKDQAQKLKEWIDWALAISPYFRQVLREADMRFIVRDNTLHNRYDNYVSGPTKKDSVFGMMSEDQFFYPEKYPKVVPKGTKGAWLMLIFHELARIHNEQFGGAGGGEKDYQKVINTQETLYSGDDKKKIGGIKAYLDPVDQEAAEFVLNRSKELKG